MEAKGLLSKFKATARAGLRKQTAETTSKVLLPFALFVVCCCCSSANPAETYRRIHKQSQQTDFAGALDAAKREFQKRRSRADDIWRWRFQLLFAELLLIKGETVQAKPLVQTAPPFAELEARRDILLAYVAYREGRNDVAQSTIHKAISAAEKTGDYESQADALLTLASLAPDDDAPAKERAILKLIEVTKSRGLHYQLAAAYLDYGLLRIHQSRFGEAIDLLEQSANTAAEDGASVLNSIAIGNLATCYYNLGDFARSRELRKKAIPVQKAAGMSTALRDSYLELGVSEFLQGNAHDAVTALRSALALASANDSPEPFALIASNLASVLESIGALDEAESLNRKAAGLVKPEYAEARGLVLSSEASILRHRGQNERAIAVYKETVGISSKYPSELWSASAALASIYAQKGDVPAARNYFELALRTIEASRTDQLKSDYQITFLSQLIGFYQDYVEFLMAHGDEVGALRVADSSRAGVLAQKLGVKESTHSAGILDISKRSEQTFLFYWLAPKRSYLWVVCHGELHSIPLQNGTSIANDARAYRNLLEREKIDPLAVGHQLPVRLFETLVQPALPWIAQGSEVVIIPDDALHGLNFEALVVPSPKPHYWLEDATLSVAPSLSLLSTYPQRATQRTLLVIGDPDYTGTGVAQLDSAGEEIDQLVQRFGARNSVVERSRDAVPHAYRNANPSRFSTIHFAAHAEVNEQSPLESAILLGKDNGGYRLYAHEITETPLTADLVTLSACRSAGARTFTGEGLVGFAWAFFQAGARNVVAGLWDVNDRSTADLMNAFYGNIDAGMSYVQSLRKAKLALLETNFRKPYYWAPFQLYSRSVNPGRNILRVKNGH